MVKTLLRLSWLRGAGGGVLLRLAGGGFVLLLGGGCPFHSNRLCGVLGGVLPAILVPGCVSTLPGTKASQRRHAWALKIAGGFTWKE